MIQPVFWGHTAADFQKMFALETFPERILEFSSGISTLNLELNNTHTIHSIDPRFALDKDTLKCKAELIFHDMQEQVMHNESRYNFVSYGGLDTFIRKRYEGMQRFFADYDTGITEGRYRSINSMQLPYEDFYFDLAMSSHYFFAGLAEQDVNFHVRMLQELARVAKEVRIFPLVHADGSTPQELGPTLLALQQAGYGAEVRSIIDPLEPAGNAMLRVWRLGCNL